jgi:hypothetical protein
MKLHSHLSFIIPSILFGIQIIQGVGTRIMLYIVNFFYPK